MIDGFNKKENINLIILNIGDVDTLNNDLENYLINLNKKVLIISTCRVDFKNYFINRSENVDNFYLTYFNNDIQYGSKYILKRVLDIVISLMAISVASSTNFAYLFIHRLFRWFSYSNKTKTGSWSSWKSF